MFSLRVDVHFLLSHLVILQITHTQALITTCFYDGHFTDLLIVHTNQGKILQLTT